MKRLIALTLIILFFLFVTGIAIEKLSSLRTFQFFGGNINSVRTHRKEVALTFDDGPSPKVDDILAILAAENVKATFFLVGREIKKYPAEARKIVVAGHQIGNHTYSHERMIFKSPAFIKKKIEDTDRLIREIGYRGTIQFRPPFGRKLVFLPYYLKQNKRKTILWTIEPNSFPRIDSSAAKIARYVVDKIKPGSIILLHPMYNEKGKTINTSILSLKGLIEGVKSKGYQFKTVNELVTSF